MRSELHAVKKEMLRFFHAAVRSLVVARRHFRARSVPGSIRVDNQLIESLEPLGGFHRPGITKAGRLSLRGKLKGRTVKVYSVHSPAQSALRVALQAIEPVGCALPEIVAADDHLIAEAWIDGTPASELRGSDSAEAKRKLEVFLRHCEQSRTLAELARQHAGAFCYLNDYLVQRLGIWLYWDPVKVFAEEWRIAAQHFKEHIESRISHPDLSANNLILERSSGRLIIIDNELLGVGQGWILDRRNSWLGADSAGVSMPSEGPEYFVELTWRLRRLGSALDAGDFSAAVQLAQGATPGRAA